MKILLVDDHALFRDGILLVLEGLAPSIDAFVAGSYEAAKTIIDEQGEFDLVLLDLGLPGVSYLDALLAVRQQLPGTMLVVLSGTDDHQMVEQALHHGARGYIPKSSSAKIMLNALQLVISGGIYIPAEILHKKLGETAAPATVKEDATGPEQLLTPRQCAVLNQVAEGKSNKEIASTLELTESTVRAHVSAILKAFNSSNRTQAVQYAMQKGWLKVSP